MNDKKRFTSLKTKIIFSTLVPVIVSFTLIGFVIFTTLFNSLYDTAKSEFLQITQKYAADFERKLNSSMDYLTIIASTLEMQVETGNTDREMLQKTVLNIFDSYGVINGSSIYFESNQYDGRDAEYTGTEYGSEKSGRICWYYYIDGGKTSYLTEVYSDETEFLYPHYTEAKRTNQPIYTDPTVYEIEGENIPMFTLTYPVKDSEGQYIGAVTTDLFLEDIYTGLQNETIYETGYIIIANDNGRVIYSPRFEDIGKTREEAGLNYELTSENAFFFNAKSIINGKSTLITMDYIYIPQLDSHFYISVAAPIEEINAGGLRIMVSLILFSIFSVIIIAFLLYYLIDRITAPLNDITVSVDKIANGEYNARINGSYYGEFAVVKDSVNAMADSIEAYVEESKGSLNILKSILNGLDAYIYVTVPDTGEILFINENMIKHFNIKGDGIGHYCYKLLQEEMSEMCDFCPCHKLDIEPGSKVVWEEYNTITKRHYRNTDCYIDWIGGIKVHLQHSVDITDIKTYMEDKLKAEHMTFEMKHEKERAEAAAQAKNNFLAKMSHEIRTPMNAVMGMIELILRRELPADVYENALMIKNAGINLLSIINDILDFSKIESGMLEIIEAEYMLPSLINDVISIIRIRLIDRPIHFVVNIDPSVPASLVGDEIRIRQMLINLLNNAVKYTNEGYISLTITGEVSGDSVTFIIEVSDSGIGIKEEDITKLFGDFVQINMDKNKGIEGTGLGLAISYSICQAMGGDITVRSEYGKGSTFTVSLTQKFVSYVPFASVEHSGEKSVLLYETRQAYRDSVTKTLESLGVEYKSVENIPSLFENVERYPYIFVSSFVYGSIQPVLLKMDKPPNLVLLSDITEMIAPKDARILMLPTHALSIANILNDIYDDYAGIHVTGISFTAPDAKILIVDDITANLKVAEGLLMPYGVQVTLCTGGQEAVGLVASNYYDLVFMDHMMPKMDGLEATGHIRAMEGEYFKTLPIVALTANAVSGVKEMFIQNGMNDFLAKPIETAKLDIILEKWILKDKQKKVKTVEQLEEKGDFVVLLQSVPELSVKKALSVVGGSANTYERIVRLSIRLLPENILRLNELIDININEYAIEVHGIKGVLNNMGAYGLGEKALELEELSKSGYLEACRVLHPGFIKELTEFYDFMCGLIEKTNDSSKIEGDISHIQNALHQLDEAIEFYDSAMALEVVLSITGYTFGEEVDKIIGELTNAFERFDFDKAAELVDELKGMVDINGSNSL